jgi:hypothetical protein
MSIEEYQKDLEIAMIRASVVKEEEVKMFRFFRGLNREITNMVELQPYMDLDELAHLATKVDKQIKRKSSARPNGFVGSSSSWKSNYRR